MATKCCSKCGVTRNIEEFPLRDRASGKRHGVCVTCRRTTSRNHYQTHKDVYKQRARAFTTRTRNQNRQRLLEYLIEHPCVDCGESDAACLDFDHREAKQFNISFAVAQGFGWATLEAE